MGSVNEYYYEYDDPYKLLAYSVLGDYRASDVIRMLSDDAFVLNCIAKENRAQDFKGRFIDCIIEDILAHKKRMEYMHELDALSLYYFSQLDLPRFRKELSNALNECGIELDSDDYASGDKVSSANT